MCIIKKKSIYILFAFLFLSFLISMPQNVQAQVETDPPYVVQVTPEDGMTSVPIDAPIYVEFSEPMFYYSTEYAFSIYPTIDFIISSNSLNTVFSLQYDMFLSYGTTYEVTIDAQAEDPAGNTLQQTPYVWSFITEALPWSHTYEIVPGLWLDVENVQALFGADNGDVWVALVSGDVFRFDGSTFQSIPESLGTINAFAQDSQGKIWVASEEGIHVYDDTVWTHYNTGNSDLANDSIKCIAIDSMDQIWAGTSNSGLYQFDGLNWSNYYMDNSGISNDWVTAMHIDADDRIWIGTLSGDVDSFDPQTDTWTNHTSDIISQTGIGSNFSVYDIVSGEGQVWIGTNEGLLSYDPASYSWDLFNQAGGYLLDDSCESLVWKPGNTLWIGTPGGINTFDGTVWDSVPIIDAGPGVLKMTMDAYGHIWIGTTDSLSTYDDDSPSVLSFTPTANQKKVSRSTKIVINFSEPMDPASVLGALSISPSFGYTSSWNAHFTQLTVTPSSQLSYNKKYTVTITTAASDLMGNGLPATVSWAFTTVSQTSSTTTTTPGFPSTVFFPSVSTFGLPSSSSFLSLSRGLPTSYSLGRFSLPSSLTGLSGLGGMSLYDFTSGLGTRSLTFPSTGSFFSFPSGLSNLKYLSSLSGLNNFRKLSGF